MDVHLIPTITHGRVLVSEPRAVARKGILVGFHGYMESARTQMERLEAIPGASAWTLVSIQGCIACIGGAPMKWSRAG